MGLSLWRSRQQTDDSKNRATLLQQAVFQPRKLTVPLRVVYGIKEYLYCYLIHFCNTFDDNNRSVSFGFVRFRSVSWKRATALAEHGLYWLIVTLAGRIWLILAEYDLYWLIVTLAGRIWLMTGRICSQSKVCCRSALHCQFSIPIFTAESC